MSFNGPGAFAKRPRYAMTQSYRFFATTSALFSSTCFLRLFKRQYRFRRDFQKPPDKGAGVGRCPFYHFRVRSATVTSSSTVEASYSCFPTAARSSTQRATMFVSPPRITYPCYSKMLAIKKHAVVFQPRIFVALFFARRTFGKRRPAITSG